MAAASRRDPRPLIIPWLAAACLLSVAQAAAVDLRLAVVPAWDGRFVVGGETEIGIALSADTGGSYRIRISGTGFQIEQGGVIEPGQPLTTALPVRPGSDGRLAVEVAGPGGSAVSQTIELRAVARPLRVHAGGDPPDTAAAAPLQISPQRLPKTLAGYAPVGQLRLDGRALSELDAAQRQALTDYIGRCGALRLADDAQRFLAAAQALAGCGEGQFSDAAADRTGQPAAAISHHRLGALLDGAPGITGTRWLVLVFGFYVLALIALPRHMRTPHAVWGLAVLTGLGILAYASWRTPSAQGVVLVEAPSGALQGRLSAMLRLHGDGLRPSSVEIDGRLSPPSALDGAETSLAMVIGPVPHFRIATTPPLLGRQDYALQGAVPLSSRPLIRVGVDQVELVNAGTRSIPAGMLAFANRLVATPALEAGAQWTAADAAPDLAWTPAAGLLRELGLNDRATWMVPLPSSEAQTMSPLSQRNAWLMVHVREHAS